MISVSARPKPRERDDDQVGGGRGGDFASSPSRNPLKDLQEASSWMVQPWVKLDPRPVSKSEAQRKNEERKRKIEAAAREQRANSAASAIATGTARIVHPRNDILFLFLSASSHFYKRSCPSVGWSVGQVTHLFDDPYVVPY